MKATTAYTEARWRGVIVELIRRNHMKQEPRLGNLVLAEVLHDIIGPQIGMNQVNTMLQDLQSAGYIRYQQTRDEDDGSRVIIEEIELTHEGLRLAGGFKKDEMVKILL